MKNSLLVSVPSTPQADPSLNDNCVGVWNVVAPAVIAAESVEAHAVSPRGVISVQ